MSLNNHMIIGNLGSDATIRTTTSGRKVSNFSVCTNEGYKDKDGNWINVPTWHNVSLFNPSDHKLNTLKEGVKVFVEGPVRKTNYEKDGAKKQFVRIQASKVEVLDKTVELQMAEPAAVQDDTDLPT